MMIKWGALSRIADAHEQWRTATPTNLATNYVAGEGDNPEAFIIGEAPGADEDVRRRPFVGKAGLVLRQLMELARLQADDRGYADVHDPPNCWLTNVIKFRPLPRNRTPNWEEIQAVRSLLRREWVAVGRPRLIIPVGSVALSAVLGHQRTSILRAAGKCHMAKARDGELLYIWPMVHPSYVLRQNSETLQALIENDWDRLGKWRARRARNRPS